MRPLRVLFVEPPKDTWFAMGEYLPPPLGILQLASYLEDRCENVEIEVLDCQATNVNWRGLAKNTMSILKRNDIFSQAMLIIGERRDSAESITRLRLFADEIDPDLAIFAALTPLPGTRVYNEALRNGWIEDRNWAHYDMICHNANGTFVAPSGSRRALYALSQFLRFFFAAIQGMFSTNALKRQICRYLAGQGLMKQLKDLFWRAPDA